VPEFDGLSIRYQVAASHMEVFLQVIIETCHAHLPGESGKDRMDDPVAVFAIMR
jgi:hypothetical protein